jgi:hypothetical protein
MKNSEEAIEKVLMGLREADAPAGMERRVLEAVEGRAAEGTCVGWWRLTPGWLFAPAQRVRGVSVAGAVLTGVVAVALLLVANRRFEPAAARSALDRARVEVTTPAASEVMAKDAWLPSPKLKARMGRRTGLGRVRVGRVRVGSVRVAGGGDSVALREMRAASHPAPPLPLTEQERLLVRIAETGSPQEIALLNPEMRAKEEAKREAEFQRAFEQPRIDIE